jgi:hypothetical protein
MRGTSGSRPLPSGIQDGGLEGKRQDLNIKPSQSVRLVYVAAKKFIRQVFKNAGSAYIRNASSQRPRTMAESNPWQGNKKGLH